MLKETGRVVAIESDSLWVETIQRSTCGSCAAKKGCGQSLLHRLGAKPVHLKVLLNGKKSDHYQLNDYVDIAIPEDIVVKNSLWIYLFPLILMLVISGIAHTYLSNELLSIVMGIAGLLLGGLVIRLHANKYHDDVKQHPVLLDSI
jgi:sigma-E factor negative regulatory protein RseC